MNDRRRIRLTVILFHLLAGVVLLVWPWLSNLRRPPDPPETIEVNLDDLPPPPPPLPPEPPPPIEDDSAELPPVLPTPTPPPRPTPTPLPSATATPLPPPTATPRPAATPTPRPPLLTAEQIRERIARENPAPAPTPVRAPALSPEEIARRLAQGLPTTGTSGVGRPSTPGALNFGEVTAELKQRLHSAWQQPRHLSAIAGLKVAAVVEVRKDGGIRSARLLRSSGNAEMDRSVEQALSAVTFAKPLPAAYTQAARSFEIEFELSP